MNKLEGCKRHEVLNLLATEDAVGVELGVAAGGFSKRMVDSGLFRRFFGVDMYADIHDTEQYKTALRTVGLFAPYSLLRMTFDEAFDLFEDESVDFIYIDGYAYSGQEGGDTIWKWSRKVRVGGVIAGDDYTPRFPLVKAAVDRFIEDTGFELHQTTVMEEAVEYSEFPSWATIKTRSFTADAPEDMVRHGKAEGRRIGRNRARFRPLEVFLKRHMPEGTIDWFESWNRQRKARRR